MTLTVGGRTSSGRRNSRRIPRSDILRKRKRICLEETFEKRFVWRERLAQKANKTTNCWQLVVLFAFCARRSRHTRSEEHTSELQSLTNLVCRLLLEKKKKKNTKTTNKKEKEK